MNARFSHHKTIKRVWGLQKGTWTILRSGQNGMSAFRGNVKGGKRRQSKAIMATAVLHNIVHMYGNNEDEFYDPDPLDVEEEDEYADEVLYAESHATASAHRDRVMQEMVNRLGLNWQHV